MDKCSGDPLKGLLLPEEEAAAGAPWVAVEEALAFAPASLKGLLLAEEEAAAGAPWVTVEEALAFTPAPLTPVEVLVGEWSGEERRSMTELLSEFVRSTTFWLREETHSPTALVVMLFSEEAEEPMTI